MAVAASAAVHVGLFAAPFAGFGMGSGRFAEPSPPLHVALEQEHEATTAVESESEFLSMPGPREAPPPPVVVARAAERVLAPPTQPSARAGVPLDIPVEAEPVIAITRIGDELLKRTMEEFPVEIGWPVRIHGKIRARYPPAALEAGREDTVIVWVVVDAQANVEEIQVVEGAEEFVDAAIDAVKAAQFHPAALDGVGISFPIALEFRFALGTSNPQRKTITAATP